jgi:hypothetical protein
MEVPKMPEGEQRILLPVTLVELPGKYHPWWSKNPGRPS